VADAIAEPEEAGGFGEFEEAAPTTVDEDDDWEPPVRRSYLPLLALVLGGLLVGVGAGFGAGLAARPVLMAPPPVEEPEEVAVMQDLGVLNVNLRGDGGSRILTVRAQVDVQTFDEAAVAAQVPVLRDTLLLLASDHTASQMMAGRSRERFRKELRQRLELLLVDDRVTQVFLTELVVK